MTLPDGHARHRVWHKACGTEGHLSLLHAVRGKNDSTILLGSLDNIPQITPRGWVQTLQEGHHLVAVQNRYGLKLVTCSTGLRTCLQLEPAMDYTESGVSKAQIARGHNLDTAVTRQCWLKTTLT